MASTSTPAKVRHMGLPDLSMSDIEDSFTEDSDESYMNKDSYCELGNSLEENDPLGISLEGQDLLGISLVGGNTVSDSFVNICTGDSLPSGTDHLGISLTNDYEEQSSLNISTDDYNHGDSSDRRPLGQVNARNRVKPVSSYVLAEVEASTALKSRNVSLAAIQKARLYVCSCGNNCGQNLSFRCVRKLRADFWELPYAGRFSKLTQLMEKSTKRLKATYVCVQETDLCIDKLKAVLNVNQKFYQKVVRCIRKGGKSWQGASSRKKSVESLEAITWIECYANNCGDRMPNSSDILLPFKTRKRDLYNIYRKEKTNRVSETQFYNLWKQHFPQLKIKQTNAFSKCNTCAVLEREMSKHTCPRQRGRYRQLRDDHNQFQMHERRLYYKKRDQAAQFPSEFMSIIIDGMDQSKTSLPHFAGRLPKFVNPSECLKTHITGVIDHGLGTFSTYVDFNQYQHDPNLTMNVIMKTIEKASLVHEKALPKTLFLQSDNCSRENKNRYVLAFCGFLVESRMFDEVHMSFLPVGHTHEDIDAGFSKIAANLNKNDAETIEALLKLSPNSIMLDGLLDLKAWLEPYVCAVRNISKPLHFLVALRVNKTSWFYKGQQDSSWSEMDPALTKIPQGRPKSLLPTMDRVNIDRLSNQVSVLKSYFKDNSALSSWEKFIKKPLHSSTTRWIVPMLPKQQARTDEDLLVPSHIQDLLRKDTANPVVKTTFSSFSL